MWATLWQVGRSRRPGGCDGDVGERGLAHLVEERREIDAKVGCRAGPATFVPLERTLDQELFRAREGFFQSYRSIAPDSLTIEYVGQHMGDGWPILENMWQQNQSKIEIEEVEMILSGNEVACHNRNKVKGTETSIETIEIYCFGDKGDLHVRYFIRS